MKIYFEVIPMKRIISAVLLVAMLSCALMSCNKYPPKRSTREERRVVMTLSLDGEEYEIKYELYRALFLNYKSQVDGGNAGVWSSDQKNEYINKINTIIAKKAAEIYSVFHLAGKLGIDPYSKDVDKQIDEYIRISVEGNEADVIGFGGDYDAYLDALKQNNLNYSLQVLLFRYDITMNLINEYYKGYEDEALGHIPGDFSYTKDDVRGYYFSDSSSRILHAYLDEGYGANSRERIEYVREGMLSKTTDTEVALYIINNTAVTATDLIINKKVSGVMVGNYTLGEVYSVYKDTAFAIEVGEVSEVIEINDGVTTYYVLYKLPKTEEHFADCYDDIASSYLDNKISELLADISSRLAGNVEYTKKYSKITHSEISM